MDIKTSLSDPLYVTWLTEGLDGPTPDGAPGRLGLTFAPGKRAPGAFVGARWERDLDADLDALSAAGTGLLVCLLEDPELQRLGIPELVGRAESRMRVVRLPIRDGDVPRDERAVRATLRAVVEALFAGTNVVLHCRGGLGRAGTIGGCVLRELGWSTDEVFARLARRHRTSCPETEAQRAYVRAWTPSDATTRHDRVAGSVLAAAIGDALGHPTEFLSMEAIRARFGPRGVRDFALFLEEGGQRFAPFTDDTQMSELVIEALLAEGTDDLDRTMQDLARRFVGWSEAPRGGHRAPGNACLAGCRALQRGAPWREAGGERAGGCGSVMRGWPFGLVFAELAEAERWAVEHSRLTHRDPIALAACAAIAWGVGLAARGEDVDAIARAMIDAAARHSLPTAEMMKRAHAEARDGTPPEVTLDRLRGWAAHEAIAGALYVFSRHGDDPREALLEGANTPGDSDSLASIAGALVGARVGLRALPARWVRDVERRDALLASAGRLASRFGQAG